MEVQVADSPKAAARSLAGRITVIARQAMARRGVCNIALGGGPEATLLHAALVDTEIFWGRVNVYQVAERVDGASPYGPVLEAELAEQVGLPPGRLHRIDLSAGPAAAVARYTAGLPKQFDVVQLALADAGVVDAVPFGTVDAAPVVTVHGDGADWVSLGPALVNAAELRVLLVLGEERREALAGLRRAAPFAAGVGPADPVVVYADRAAAG